MRSRKRESYIVLAENTDHELPVIVTDTIAEMSRVIGVRQNNISAAICKGQKITVNGEKYKIYKIYCDNAKDKV